MCLESLQRAKYRHNGGPLLTLQSLSAVEHSCAVLYCVDNTLPMCYQGDSISKSRAHGVS